MYNIWFVIGVAYITFWTIVAIWKTIETDDNLWYIVRVFIVFTIPFILGILSRIN